MPDTITEEAAKAAIDFVEVCCQQTAFIAGRDLIENEIKLTEAGINKSYTIIKFCIFGLINVEEITEVQSSKTPVSVKTFGFTLPGREQHLSSLLATKKFRNRGDKEGALMANIK